MYCIIISTTYDVILLAALIAAKIQTKAGASTMHNRSLFILKNSPIMYSAFFTLNSFQSFSLNLMNFMALPIEYVCPRVNASPAAHRNLVVPVEEMRFNTQGIAVKRKQAVLKKAILWNSVIHAAITAGSVEVGKEGARKEPSACCCVTWQENLRVNHIGQLEFQKR